MGERKGQNKYYPPDFDYKVHKSLAGYHGQHPLRERARKLDRGILIIRFEMPYNIWCDGCNNHIGMGVRYNAEKSKDGMYYTTPIYKFRMKCHLCDNHFEIKTDPANHDYVIISGARRKEQRWDPHENEQIVPEDRATQKQLALDSMYRLEHGEGDRAKGKAKQSTISQIIEHRDGHKDDFALNQLARKQFREAKKAQIALQSKDDDIKCKYGLSLPLLEESPDDTRMAKLLKFSCAGGSQIPSSAESRLLFSPANKSSTSGKTLTSSLSKKDISIKHLRQIASSEVTRKRADAFQSPVGATVAQNNISNGIIVRRKSTSSTDHSSSNSNKADGMTRLEDSIPDCNAEEESECTQLGHMADVSPSRRESASQEGRNSALSALCDDYQSSNDENNDSN